MYFLEHRPLCNIFISSTPRGSLPVTSRNWTLPSFLCIAVCLGFHQVSTALSHSPIKVHFSGYLFLNKCNLLGNQVKSCPHCQLPCLSLWYKLMIPGFMAINFSDCKGSGQCETSLELCYKNTSVFWPFFDIDLCDTFFFFTLVIHRWQKWQVNSVLDKCVGKWG